MGRSPVRIYPLPLDAEIQPGCDLGGLIAPILASHAESAPGQVVIVAQKAVSKAERRLVFLDEVVPGARAHKLAEVTGKSPALVELALGESTAVVRATRGVLIVRHQLGFVIANAGIDQSNVPSLDGRETALLLPRDPEASARRIQLRLASERLHAPAVIVSDSFGRPWRKGVVNVALGSAGLPALVDLRGRRDRNGRPLQSTEVALADALAAAAGLVMGEADEATPFVLIEGRTWDAPEVGASCLVRPLAEDLFQ